MPPTDDELEDDTNDNTNARMDNEMDGQTDGDRQLTTDSDAIDEGGTNDSDLGADVAGDIGPKHS